MKKIILSWSGGKDSSWMLKALRDAETYEILSLVTSVRAEDDISSLHETPVALLEKQAECLGLPLHVVRVPAAPTGEVWENLWLETLNGFKKQGVHEAAYGDLFLEDIRAYREKIHKKSPLLPVFPIWKLDTRQLAHDFIEAGFEALIASVDLKKLPESLVGQPFDRQFLKALPEGVDPCGENGEFHTFVHDGPIFQKPVPFRKGKTLLKSFGGKAHAFEIAYAELAVK